MNETYYTTIGMDVSDRKTQVCVMTKTGTTPKVVMETAIPMHFCHDFDFGTGDTTRDLAMVRPLHGTPIPTEITII